MPAQAIRDHAVVLRPGDRVVSDTVAAIGRQIAAACQTERPRIVIDLLAVDFVETAALSELCALLHGASDRGVRCAIVGADPRVRWTLDTCRIDDLELYPTLRAATRPTLTSRVRTLLDARSAAARGSSPHAE